MKRLTPLALRLLAVAAAGLLLLGLVLATSRDRTDQSTKASGTSLGAPPDDTSVTATNPATSSNDVAVDVTGLPGDPSVLDTLDGAEAAGGQAVLAAALSIAEGAWPDLLDDSWRQRTVDLATAQTLPVYVGELDWDGATGQVTADLLIVPGAAWTPGKPLTLRFLPGAAVLARADAGAAISATVAGVDVPVSMDADAATATIDLVDVNAPNGELAIRLAFSYRVPVLRDIVDDGGPAGFGLLARTNGAAMLGHWMPLLTFDAGPMVPWGDVGAFPPAIFSVEIQTTDTVVTGGVESDCTSQTAGCTLARGIALRDLSVATFSTAPQIAAAAPGVRAIGADTLAIASVQAIADESAAARRLFDRELSPLPWPELDVVLLPLRSAAGMEFPGLVIVDPEYLNRLGGGFGTFVAVHEVAHQWFHALVGNSSLEDAVVDESVAQYLSHRFYADTYSEASADELFQRYLVNRYRAARKAGMVDIAPASPLAAFRSDVDYGPLVYGRSPLAWTVAEAAIGREAVLTFLADLVRDRGLGTTSSMDVLARAESADSQLASILDRWWFDPTPMDDELP